MKILILPGDGIGPEVTAEAVRVLEAVAVRHGHAFRLEQAPEQTFGPAAADGTRPGDLFNSRATWAQVLEPAGWRSFARFFRRGDIYQKW